MAEAATDGAQTDGAQTDEAQTDGAERASPAVAAGRLATGFLQGVGLYLLREAGQGQHWPATTPWLYGGLLLVFALVPVIVIGGLGRIRPVLLAAWVAVAAAALALFGWHDIDAGVWSGLYDGARFAPAFPTWLVSIVFVFVGHHLVGPASEAKKLLAPYRLYFDWAWKDGVQLALAVLFVGVLWGALALGAALFNLIGIDAFSKLIGRGWFSFPVTGLAFAAAVQLTDVRVGLIRGVRMVVLVLLSWLLPLLAAIVIAFLLALPITGLTPLFGARSAASTVLWACAALIVLTSAAYQDGEAKTHLAPRWAARAAGVALVPLVLIAADALAQRVGEYGLSPSRIVAVVCAIVAAGFAIGYAFAAVRPKGPWMRPLELTNVIMARVAMALILLVFTPIADPARLSVDDQVSRLMAGRISPDQFDFRFLHFQSGRYGDEALKRLEALAGSPRNLAIAGAAKAGAATDYAGVSSGPPVPRFQAYPVGTVLPPTFLAHNWASWFAVWPTVEPYLPCYGETPTQTCEAYVADVDGDGHPEVIIGAPASDSNPAVLTVYKQAASGDWTDAGVLLVRCDDAIAALRAGKLTLAPRTGSDVTLAGHRQTLVLPDQTPCAGPPPAAKPPTHLGSPDTAR